MSPLGSMESAGSADLTAEEVVNLLVQVAPPSVDSVTCNCSSPEPFAPGRVTPVNFEMQDVNHTFRRGHRIMVQLQSSWFQLVDLNPQTFVNIPAAIALQKIIAQRVG